jgi:threonine/homoserine/homoserine lactone efflux protein
VWDVSPGAATFGTRRRASLERSSRAQRGTSQTTPNKIREVLRFAQNDKSVVNAILNSTLVSGFVLGWSIAWPPGPINAEMIRRSLLPSAAGGGFWSAWPLGLGATSGDFCWALGVTAGAGALMNTPRVRFILGVISFVLLLFLAGTYAIGAWRAAREHRDASLTNGLSTQIPRRRRGGYFLGFTLALASPFNIGFWLAVIGSQQRASHTFLNSLALASSVVLGALTWTLVLCLAVRQGARIFARPSWQILTQALTAVVMIYFAIRLGLQLH